jgi:LPXTG-site transpeptidase (sortase) family protein
MLPTPKRSRIKRAILHVRVASPSKKRGYGLIALAATLFIVGVGVNLNSLLVTKKIEAQSANIDSSGGNGTAGENGRPGSSAGLSEQQPDATAVKNYTVAGDIPKYINIGSLGVFARVVRVGVDTNSQVGTPRNVFDAAWYDGSSKPGQPGAAFIDGHVLGPTKGGVFAALKNIKVGAKIVITLGDNSKITYRVVATEKVDATKVDMQKVLRSYDSTKQGLNLMTCNGTYQRDQESFDKRLIVYTVRD